MPPHTRQAWVYGLIVNSTFLRPSFWGAKAW